MLLAASVVKMREIAYYFDSVVQDCKEEAPAWLDELDDETRDVLIALSRVVELKVKVRQVASLVCCVFPIVGSV